MDSGKNQVEDSLESMLKMMIMHGGFETGELEHICRVIDEDPSLLQMVAPQLYEYLLKASDYSRSKKLDLDHLALITIESLLFNLYHRYHANPSASFYNTSSVLSSSHLSMSDHSMVSMKMENWDENPATKLVEDLSTNDRLMRKLKSLSTHGSKQKNLRYVEILLETIEYMLRESKNEGAKHEFEEAKTRLTSAISQKMEKQAINQIVQEVNSIIFSNKINRIIYMLMGAERSVFISLHRLYGVHEGIARKKRKDNKLFKYMDGVEYRGKTMVYNLCKYYIESIGNEKELFQESKNPLYIFISMYFVQSSMPVFRDFFQIVQRCCRVTGYEGVGEFYQLAEPIIYKDLVDFIDMLPFPLMDFLCMLHHLVDQTYGPKPSKNWKKPLFSEGKKQNSSTIPIKKLLLYSFLMKQELIEAYSMEVELDKYEQVCNYIINLFFLSSLKKYEANSLPLEHYKVISDVTERISEKMDDRIVSFPTEAVEDEGGYIIEEPIINYDYEHLLEVIGQLEFTPKDLREFSMEMYVGKQQEVQGMWQKNKPKQEFPKGDKTPLYLPKFPYHSLQLDDDEDQELQYPSEDEPFEPHPNFLTWMSVGGSNNYCLSKTHHSGPSSRVALKLSEYSLPKEKMEELQKLQQQYKKIIN